MASETQCGTNEVPVASTPANEAPQMATTDTSTVASNLPPIEAEGIKKPNQTSYVWGHFILLEGERAECKYCGKTYAAGSKIYGTTNLRTHLESRCKKYPYGKKNMQDKTQMTLAFKPKKSDDAEGTNSNSLIAVSYNESMCREALARMIIVDELPFKFVEHEGFRYYSNVLQPRFIVPTRTTVARDCIRLYSIERDRLKIFLEKSTQRISLTTDTWTSIQNINYMCLTAHFIDDDWQYHKRILNFRQVPNHKGETIGKVVESLLLSWGIDKIFTLTVDNAASNSGIVTYLDRITKEWGASILDGEFMHMRCCAHIVNLIVMEGLKSLHESIVKVRNAVRYVRSSPSRYDKFKACVEKVKIASKGCVCLDVPTRWNSTYMMLENAEKFQRAFERLRVNDAQYIRYFLDDGNGKKILGPPDFEDWDNVKVFVKFLKLFYEVTLRFSGSLYVTSNVFFHELCVMKIELTNLCESEDPLLSMMARDMHEKFDKYWGDIERLNLMMFVAVVLDPRYKLRFVNFWFAKWNSGAVADDMTKKVKKTLVRMYEHYCNCDGFSNGQGQDGSSSNNVETRPIQDPHTLVKSIYKKHLAMDSLESKSEVERYLADCVEEDSPNFSILNWWKVNSSKYRLLSKVARDVLAIPLSTVASESAFSTGGRVLDPFRSSLLPNTVEMLICAQNWLRATDIIDLQEAMEEVESYESLESEFASQSTITVEEED